ncbi:MAG: zf-HC2 domain-containing protein [Bryobacteraceae bacterium]
MDHQSAIQAMAAQRYLLGELEVSEQEAFEAHYFDCVHCASEVRDSAVFVENLKAVLREQPARSAEPVKALGLRSLLASISPFRGFEWTPAFAAPALAALAFAMLAGYQRFVEIPGLRVALTPRAAVTAIIDPAGVRAAGKVITVAADDLHAVVPFSFEVPAGARSVRLQFFRGERTGAEALPIHEETIAMTPEAGGASVLLSVPLPLGTFGEGEFSASAQVLYADGESWTEAAERYQFRIARR